MTDAFQKTVPAQTSQGVQVPPTSVIPSGEPLTHPVIGSITPAVPSEEALPDDYDPFQHLKQVYYPQHNAAVALYFSDLPTDWKPNIATARSSLRVACTISPDDNELLIAMRHRLFWDLLGYGNSNLVVYNGSTNDIAPPVEGHPKICFYFSQDVASVPHGTTRLDAEYSFRLLKETPATITKAKLTTLATLIKE
ncbi:MAG: hypothetical protein ACYT04_52535, partial [Nostoc sp.]